jgi:chromosome partitioning protein
MSKIIAVTNQKGGVGKTTTSINLSACIAAKGKRVLVVDADPQGNTSSGLGVKPQKDSPTVYEVIAGEVEPAAAIVKTQEPTLFLMPSDIRLAGAEIELASIDNREQIFASALRPLKDQYDFIFIDCPPSLGLITVNTLCAADSVLIPIQCEYYALEGVSALMGTIQKVQKINRSLTIEGIVLTMLDARTNLGIQVAKEVRRFFKTRVYTTAIPRNVRLGEAPSHGLPIHLYDQRSLGAQSYDQLADEFLKAN